MFGFGKLNAAVVGTGYMASRMSEVISSSGAVRPYAVVSRDLDRALQFGREKGYKKAYDSMEKMLDDKKVDLVYIATPASEHAEQVRICIERGKPVLCETPIALTAADAESLFSLATSLDVLVVEAVHTRFLPFFKQIVSVISSGAVGTPVMLTANIAADMEELPRMQRPSLGGGALGDLGYFLLNFSSMIFGDQVKRIQSSCVFTPTRVDRQLSVVLQYKDDRMAVLSCTTSGNGESRAVIQGTKGYMVIDDLRNFSSATIYDSKRNKAAQYKRGRQKSEFEYELAAFVAAKKSGWKECPEIPHAQSISIMHMMDFIRRQLGISYEDIQTAPIPDLIGSTAQPGAQPQVEAHQQPVAIEAGEVTEVPVQPETVAEPEAVMEAEAEAQPEAVAEEETEAQPEAMAEEETEARPEEAVEPETEAHSETAGEPDNEAQPEDVSGPENAEASAPEEMPEEEDEETDGIRFY